jgi:acetyl-CoA/propionyl-CoA carboxylase biotin carboxyl carrier protein
VHTQWIETTFAARVPAESLRDASAEPGITETWIEIDGRRHSLRLPAGVLAASMPAGAGEATELAPVRDGAAPADSGVVAPISGVLTKWLVEDGATVAVGDSVAVMEAMKMETPITVDVAGVVTHVAAAGDELAAGARLAVIEPPQTVTDAH